MLVENSRLLFGVCDERDALREGEVFVRIEMPGTVSQQQLSVDQPRYWAERGEERRKTRRVSRSTLTFSVSPRRSSSRELSLSKTLT